MAEYIEREATIKAIYESDPNGIRRALGFNVRQIEEALRAIPTADVAPVRHGRWDIMANTKTRHMCSSFGWDVPEYGKFYSYCPNCGAHMKKEDKSDG
jgi:hypothetical protein